VKFSNKRKNLIVLLAVVLVGAILGAICIHKYFERKIEMEQERTKNAYELANWIFWYAEGGAGPITSYRPFREIFPEENIFEICRLTYLFLKFYERETGNMLSYETVMDYFSQEFEQDGSLRLINNGKHPEMLAFAEWAFDPPQGYFQYWRDIDAIRDLYLETHEGVDLPWSAFSPKMLDALARAEADPDYVLDLTSLQQAGY